MYSAGRGHSEGSAAKPVGERERETEREIERERGRERERERWKDG